jgi:hypothetical protein
VIWVTPNLVCSNGMKLKWWFSVLLGVSYLGVFDLWRTVSSPWIVISGLSISACLAALLVVAARRRYFVNLWDGLFHASVIFDIVLEATWIERHEHVGFYLCAAAFALVLIGDRLWWVRGHSTARPSISISKDRA